MLTVDQAKDYYNCSKCGGFKKWKSAKCSEPCIRVVKECALCFTKLGEVSYPGQTLCVGRVCERCDEKVELFVTLQMVGLFGRGRCDEKIKSWANTLKSEANTNGPEEDISHLQN